MIIRGTLAQRTTQNPAGIGPGSGSKKGRGPESSMLTKMPWKAVQLSSARGSMRAVDSGLRPRGRGNRLNGYLNGIFVERRRALATAVVADHQALRAVQANECAAVLARHVFQIDRRTKIEQCGANAAVGTGSPGGRMFVTG
jgi:hypothetical protein